MRSLSLHNTCKHRTLQKFAIFIFVCILVLHGTYFRTRPSVEVPTVDWLVFARLFVCAIGFIIGIILIPKNVSWGFGAKSILLYVLAAGISAIRSPYPIIVVGYFILLLGASVLMIALVYTAQNVIHLKKLEKIWFLTVSLLVLKDSIIGLLFPEMASAKAGPFRLGMGVTHANILSFLAGLLFWLSFKERVVRHPVILWLTRFFYIFVILLAQSRVSIAAFLIAGLFFFLFSTRDYFKRWIIVFGGIGTVVAFSLLLLSFGLRPATDVVDYMRRGQSKEELASFTGRTYIWPHVYKKAMESPIIGHGYGVSRLTMGEIPHVGFEPSHCHNEVLEVFFNTGLFGLIPFFAIFLYSLRWIKNFSRLRCVFSKTLTLHAVCVVVTLVTSSFFTSNVAGRLSPVQPLFFFYLLTLDCEKQCLYPDFSGSA